MSTTGIQLEGVVAPGISVARRFRRGEEDGVITCHSEERVRIHFPWIVGQVDGDIHVRELANTEEALRTVIEEDLAVGAIEAVL